MTVQRILNEKGRGVVTCGPDETLLDIAAILAGKKIGAVVITKGDAIEGILSERDIVRAVATDGTAAMSRAASDYMTKKVITCGLQDTINDLMQKMSGGRFRHLPIVEDGKLVGIVSIGDVVKGRIAEIEREADSIREYITTA